MIEAAESDALNPFAVVGIGASAGGLDPLRRLMAQLQPDWPAAYIVALHIAPDYDSKLVKILSAHAQCRILRAESGTKLEPGTVYVTPPNHNIAVDEGGRLQLSPAQQGPYAKPNISELFASLARYVGEHALGIVLSGTGSDGAAGLRAIKQAGGVTLTQSPDDAQYDGMPRSAMATRCVDLCLPSGRMAEVLGSILVTVGNASDDVMILPRVDALQQVVDAVRGSTQIDVSHIKPTTLRRRITRRMGIVRDDDLDRYLSRLQDDPEEAYALAQSVLISVTSFFRDPEVYAELKTHLQTMLAQADPGKTVRIWVPACATGEEAYSIAMMVHEQISTMNVAPKVVVFASDLDARAIEVARIGIYSADTIAHLPDHYVERYIAKTGESGNRVRSCIRRMILFSVQNLMSDPPFSRIDFISCRNFLIYLNRAPMNRVLEVFHYALAEDGMLLLGNAESTSTVPTLFSEISRKHRIYRRVGRTRDIVNRQRG